MGEVMQFMLLRFALIGGGVLLLVIVLGVIAVALKKAGRYDQAKRAVEPIVRERLERYRKRDDG
ncbi:hypothetical protein [Amycolatopsis australiensis]|uniref:Uncharacterized protein n=1 Tax=Amycolatopsis australiensis TaxID=546364 RepID=A0A1K1T6L5_9PSEU|nr:hypothetical protein [Amycolatopsis australiensis]SFW92150.1 hypothetical protein SAMN04489730_8426 [Amycolatopsis australiensis]